MFWSCGLLPLPTFWLVGFLTSSSPANMSSRLFPWLLEFSGLLCLAIQVVFWLPSRACCRSAPTLNNDQLPKKETPNANCVCQANTTYDLCQLPQEDVFDAQTNQMHGIKTRHKTRTNSKQGKGMLAWSSTWNPQHQAFVKKYCIL